MAQGTLKIHSENILPIIKKWLYSDKDIFLRELVSNACDAMSKLKILRDQGQSDVKDEEFRIDITLDKEKKTLTIADTGIGMSAEEVEKYIAQLAFSGAEEFVSKYQTQNENDQIIGHFGLGFYSAFMVSNEVEIETLSYIPSTAPARWLCDGSSDYTLEEGHREKRGTEITLYISDESKEYLDEAKIKEILTKHCLFLPFPIYLNDTLINTKEPLWIKPASECSDQDYLDFYRHLHPLDPEPIFWIHLNVDYPFNLKGILYFPKITHRFELKENNIKLFCNRVFVSDDCRDLIPDYLTVLRGAIDSPDIPLNVSRSYLQMDRTVRQLASHISKKVSDKLGSLYKLNKDEFIKRWPDIETIIKLGILQDDKFYDRAKDYLVWKTLDEKWTTIDEYLERNAGEKIFYHNASEKQDSHFLKMYQDKGIEVLLASSYLDTPLMSFLEQKHKAKFQRIDGGIDEAILDSSKEKTLLDSDGKTEAVQIADFFRKNIDQEGLEIEAKSLASDALPAFIMISEESRRMRDYLAMTQKDLPKDVFSKNTFVLNTNSKLISSIYKLGQQKPGLAKTLSRELYELSLLGQKELDPSKVQGFIDRSNTVLEDLLDLALQEKS